MTPAHIIRFRWHKPETNTADNLREKKRSNEASSVEWGFSELFSTIIPHKADLGEGKY